ncbi:MAG: hypothetical protein ABR512_05535 [Desulfopila sp.]
MEKRMYQRVRTDGFRVDISDGKGFFPGVISDISRFGLGMMDLPKRINETVSRMTVVVTGQEKTFKMAVKPKWSDQMGLRKIIGCEIINAPYTWTDFVLKIELGKDKSPRGQIAI